jgi:tRNA threonylcarbamoyladenosine biosynthesis protein TsaB
MALILNIETSTTVCSVALAINGNPSIIRATHDANSHAEMLTVLIDEILKTAGIQVSGLDAVAVSQGPGSYTGLRIGVSTAKGLCFSADIPLIAVDTLQAMAHGAKRHHPAYNRLCPMIDARRMEVYCAVYDEDVNTIHETKAMIIDGDSFSELLDTHTVLFFGDGAGKCKSVLAENPNAHFLDDFHPSATFMSPLSYRKFLSGEFANLAYFEPYYLKDFLAGKPRVKGLEK